MPCFLNLVLHYLILSYLSDLLLASWVLVLGWLQISKRLSSCATMDYCKACPTCATSKSLTEKPWGLLKIMPVLTHPWQYIGIDFVGPLPKSSNQNGLYDMICIIIDLLTAMVHLVPTHQMYKAVNMAELIFNSVFKLHRLPKQIISDRDSLFMSHFWKKLNSLLNIKLHLSSAFHPQTDGATEHTNQTMTQMLCQCVGPKQKDWVTKLPAIEFVMNSARSSTTGFTLFFLNYRQNPSPLVWKGEEVYPGVHQFANIMKEVIMSAHDVWSTYLQRISLYPRGMPRS